jgi:hypothetical protein
LDQQIGCPRGDAGKRFSGFSQFGSIKIDSVVLFTLKESLMFRTSSILLAFITGIAAATAFIISCGQDKDGSLTMGPPSAAAQLNCTQYQVLRTDIYGGLTPETAIQMPAGWTPFTTTGGEILSVRCVP